MPKPTYQRIKEARKVIKISGNTVPKIPGVYEEHKEITVDSAIMETKKLCAYTLTMEQYIFVKTHGGSEFMRALLDWFAKAEAKQIETAQPLKTKEQQATPFSYFTFGGIPVIVDDKHTALWETYLWAKAHKVSDPEGAARKFFDFRKIDNPYDTSLEENRIPF
ncbi:hypothetical protein [uncultured Parasutterella sp.]|jgi:hypothetical protein|uniref:hypothetical protein n=1 Tax=uncultured Parasutterella sp. TaxID=1263098 RepID=UPI002046ADFD|nr:hypothetical protein [uncultured Parasutterella sp.]DAJ56216.1 MAG TPA: hypothetical protein [Caudoviricetes sp.]